MLLNVCVFGTCSGNEALSCVGAWLLLGRRNPSYSSRLAVKKTVATRKPSICTIALRNWIPPKGWGCRAVLSSVKPHWCDGILFSCRVPLMAHMQLLMAVPGQRTWTGPHHAAMIFVQIATKTFAGSAVSLDSQNDATMQWFPVCSLKTPEWVKHGSYFRPKWFHSQVPPAKPGGSSHSVMPIHLFTHLFVLLVSVWIPAHFNCIRNLQVIGKQPFCQTSCKALTHNAGKPSVLFEIFKIFSCWIWPNESRSVFGFESVLHQQSALFNWKPAVTEAKEPGHDFSFADCSPQISQRFAMNDSTAINHSRNTPSLLVPCLARCQNPFCVTLRVIFDTDVNPLTLETCGKMKMCIAKTRVH